MAQERHNSSASEETAEAMGQAQSEARAAAAAADSAARALAAAKEAAVSAGAAAAQLAEPEVVTAEGAAAEHRREQCAELLKLLGDALSSADGSGFVCACMCVCEACHVTDIGPRRGGVLP